MYDAAPASHINVAGPRAQSLLLASTALEEDECEQARERP